MLEPADSQEAYLYAKTAFEISEKYDLDVVYEVLVKEAVLDTLKNYQVTIIDNVYIEKINESIT